MSNIDKDYINNKKILSFEELLSKIDKYKTLFNKETIEYLYSLLNLEVSSIDTTYIDEDKLCILSELKMFKKLVQYNLYYKFLNLIDCSSEKYKFISNDIDLLSVYILKSILSEIHVKDDIMNLTLYKGENIITPEEQMKIIEKQIESYLLQLSKMKEEFSQVHDNIKFEYMTYTPNIIYSMENKIENLKLVTIDQLLEKYEYDKFISEQRNNLLNLFMKDNGLDVSDFEIDNTIRGMVRVKKYEYAKIYIK